VFKLIDKPSALVTDIWAAANKVMIGLNAEERQALPDFVRAELKNREPVPRAPRYVPLAHWNLFLRSAGAAFPFSGAWSGMWLSCAGAGSLPALAHGTALVPPGGAD